MKIKYNSDDDLPMKTLKLCNLITAFRSVFHGTAVNTAHKFSKMNFCVNYKC